MGHMVRLEGDDMKHLTLDVENTTVKRNGKLHLDPFEPENTLVMVGMLDDLGNEDIITFDHAEQQPTTEGRRIVQDALDATSLLIAHVIYLMVNYQSIYHTIYMLPNNCIMFCRHHTRDATH